MPKNGKPNLTFNDALKQELTKAQEQMLKDFNRPFEEHWFEEHWLRGPIRKLRKRASVVGKSKGIIVDKEVMLKLLDLAETALAFEEDNPDLNPLPEEVGPPEDDTPPDQPWNDDKKWSQSTVKGGTIPDEVVSTTTYHVHGQQKGLRSRVDS